MSYTFIKIFRIVRSALIESAEVENPTLPEEKTEKKLNRRTVRITKLSPDAQIPTYGSENAAGADIYSVENCVVPAKGKRCVSTGLQLALPYGYYGRVAPRSGLAVKNFIDVGAGVIDRDYRGEIKVLLFNFNDSPFEVKKGDRIAQLICEKIALCQYEEVSALENTRRGSGGFGSTGL